MSVYQYIISLLCKLNKSRKYLLFRNITLIFLPSNGQITKKDCYDLFILFVYFISGWNNFVEFIFFVLPHIKVYFLLLFMFCIDSYTFYYNKKIHKPVLYFLIGRNMYAVI